jgi:hypothetical protein
MSMKSSPRLADDELDRLVALGITRQQVEPGDDCLDPEGLASYADGGLSAAERTAAEAHLARCRDCRRALAFQVESDPLVASAPAAANAGIAVESPGLGPGPGPADAASTTPTGRASGVSGWPRIVKSANVWLPLAAALVVATGLYFAFDRSRNTSWYVPSAAPQLSARNESAAVKQAAEEPAAAAPREESPRAAPDRDAKPADASPRAEAEREASRAPLAGGSAALLKEKTASRTDAVAAPPPASPRARAASRDEFAAAARPNTEADKRNSSSPPAPAPALAPAPPPPPASALADAAPARAGSEAGKEAQAKVAGQLARAPLPAASPAAPQVLAPDQAAAANQNVAQQQAVINQQTGPMSNLNVAPPPAKVDEQRRQADRSKGTGNENEKNTGGPSGAKSADTKIAKAEEAEPKSLARAKTAPESPSERAAAEAPAAGGVVGGTAAGATAAAGPGATAGADRNAAGRGAGARDTSAREVNEAVTIVTAAPAPSPVLRSVDGAHWWRIRAPSTIEGSTDRGASWTVEYSEPSARLVRGAPAAKGGCWMIGANGLVLRIRPNGGWERVTQPTTRNLVALAATDHLAATVTDDQGRTYRTTDGGATWR